MAATIAWQQVDRVLRREERARAASGGGRLHGARDKGSRQPLPSPTAENPRCESLLARGCSLVRLWIGTHVLSASVNTWVWSGGTGWSFRYSGAAVRSKWLGCVSRNSCAACPQFKTQKNNDIERQTRSLFKQDDHSVALYWREAGPDNCVLGSTRLCSVLAFVLVLWNERVDYPGASLYTISAELQLPRC